MNKKITWRESFEMDFKKGDEVIFILDDDRFDWGIIDWDNEEVKLIKGPNKWHKYWWNQVVFACHDGFPIRKLSGADGSISAMKSIPVNMDEEIRFALEKENDEKERKICNLREGLNELLSISDLLFPHLRERIERWSRSIPKLTTPRRFGFGDPFIVECDQVQLFNPGNSGPNFWNHPLIETLVLRSGDGAVAHLWDLETVFFAE